MVSMFWICYFYFSILSWEICKLWPNKKETECNLYVFQFARS
jgi:hypothetical protein